MPEPIIEVEATVETLAPIIAQPEKAHARFGPSSLHYRELCSFWKNDNTPGKDMSAADRGTKLHLATEIEDINGLDEDEQRAVLMCIDYINHLKSQRPNAKHLREVRLEVLDQFGTVDGLIIDGNYADLVDFKYGFRQVEEAETNPQMQAYCLGAFDRFPELETISVHIPMPGLGLVSRAVFTRSNDYKRLWMRVFTIIERAKSPTTYDPSPEACEFCGNRASCQALSSKALVIAKGGGMDLPSNLNALAISNPEDMNQLLKIAPVIEKWCADIRTEGLRLQLEEGWEYDDFSLAERSTPRAVTSVSAAFDALKDEMTQEEFIGCVKGVSIPSLEEVFSAKAPRGKKAQEALRLECLLRDAGVLKDEGKVIYLKEKRKPAKKEKTLNQ